MELRSNQHLHYISAIKGGKVVKTLNVSRGMLMFKEMSTILDHGSKIKAIPLANRSFHNVFDPHMVKSEEDVNDNCIDGSSDERSQESDDIFCGEMTLRQLKKKCKAKKGKLPISVDKLVEQGDGGSHPKGDNIDMEETLGSLKRKVSGKIKSRKRQKRGTGLKTTVVVVKCEPVSLDEESLQLSTVSSDRCESVSFDEDPLQLSIVNSDVDMCTIIKLEDSESLSIVNSDVDMCTIIKLEDSESDCSLFQEATSSDVFCSAEHGMFSTGNCVGEMQVKGESCTMEKDSIIIVEGPNVSYPDPLFCEDHTTASSLPLEIPVCEEMMKVDDNGITDKLASELLDSDCCSPREESSFVALESKVCTLNQICYDLEDHSGDSCLPPISFTHEEALKVGESVMPIESKAFTLNRICYAFEEKSGDLCLSPKSFSHEEPLKVGDSVMGVESKVCTLNQICYELEDPSRDSCLPPETFSHEEALKVGDSVLGLESKVCTLNQICYELEDQSRDSCLPPETFSHEEALKVGDPVIAVEQPISMPALTQEDKAITDALLCNESPDILFPLFDESARNDYCTTYSHEEACPTMDGNSPKRMLNEAIGCIGPMINVSEAVPSSMDETDKESSSSFASKSIECSELQHPPERLHSARKTISPDSQQKLCRAMKSLDLPDHQDTEKCKQKLCFEKQEANADARSTSPEHSNTADTSPNSEQKMKKAKEDRRRFRSKVPLPAWYRLSSACGCIQSCSQNVIDFSQQQMTDTERLTVTLTKELRSMKELMIEMLHPQGRRAPASRFNMNEVRVAVENATKVEDTARRCLATMTRDCNRFCKIVSLAEKNTVLVGNSPNKEEAENISDKEEANDKDATNTVTKGEKKITFADESGGSLCNVRLIEPRESVLLDSPTEDIQVQSA